jgi:hypothetical protein
MSARKDELSQLVHSMSQDELMTALDFLVGFSAKDTEAALLYAKRYDVRHIALADGESAAKDVQ